MKVTAKRDITYPDEEGRPVVMYKAGDEIKNKSHAEMFVERSKELVTVDDGYVKTASKTVGKKKGSAKK